MSNTDELPQQCPAVTKAGKRCGGKVTSSGYCVAHDPQANEWRALGGHARSNASRAAKLMPARLLPIVERLEQVFADLGDGKMDERVKVALAMATVATTIGRLIQAGEYEERLREIEQLAADAGRFRDERGRDRGPIRWGTSD